MADYLGLHGIQSSKIQAVIISMSGTLPMGLFFVVPSRIIRGRGRGRRRGGSELCGTSDQPGPVLARQSGAAYAGRAVKQPFVNIEEKIDRFVGRRTGTPDSLRAGMQLQATAARLHKSFGHRWWPKGVYRFKTHEEADAWMTKMLAQSGLPKT